MIEIVDAHPSHCRPIALHMREEDRREIKRFNKTSPIRALSQSEKYCMLKWTVLEDGVPIAMFGAGEIGLDPFTDEGVIWFLGTERVRLYPREFLIEGIKYIKRMLAVFKSLTNVIDCDNLLAIRYARKLVHCLPNSDLVKEDNGMRITIRRGT
jgi:hypothetical protein